MKSFIQKWGWSLAACAALLLVAAGWLVRPVLGQSVHRLTINHISSNQFEIVVTNIVATNYYEIQRRASLAPSDAWRYLTNGTQGQSTFVVGMGIELTGFFQAVDCLDCDYDGIPSWQDGQPGNPSVGSLTITIESPLNGTTIY